MPTRIASLILALATAGCAGTGSPQGERLQTEALAARASEFHCALGRWPADAAELEAFSPPERSRVQRTPSPAPIPWSLLGEAEFRSLADGTLRIAVTLPADRLADGPASRPVALDLRVQPPGCWPPAPPGS